jgi:hypothetical protein
MQPVYKKQLLYSMIDIGAIPGSVQHLFTN